MGGKDSAIQAIPCCLAGSLDEKQNQDLKPGTTVWDVGILTAMPAPASAINSNGRIGLDFPSAFYHTIYK